MAGKTLVTGAGGFIGSRLVEKLVEAGEDVRAFVHYNSNTRWSNLERAPSEVLDQVEVVSGDICDPFSVDNAVQGCDTVYHLAALIAIPYSYVAPASYVATNVTGTLNVLEASRRHSVDRYIHTSTSETYGTAQYVPIDEKHPLVGQSPYSASKIAADKLAESYFLSFETPVTIVRPFNTFGPRQSMRAVIPTIIVQGLTREKVMLGNLSPIRDLTFVDDTAAGFMTAASSPATIGETVNLGVGNGVSIGDLVDIIGKILGKDLTPEIEKQRLRPENSEVGRLISDNAKMRRLTDWAPEHTLEQGLERTVEFVQQNLSEFKADRYIV